jgi:hypothetical protein
MPPLNGKYEDERLRWFESENYSAVWNTETEVGPYDGVVIQYAYEAKLRKIVV